MSMPLEFHTREMVLALPDDGQRYETVHGELLVTPAPRLQHQRVLERLASAIRPYVIQHGLGEVLRAPADISWGPDILVQPDLFVVAPEQADATEWSEVTRLVLVVEVVSPSSSRADRFTKRRLYQERGIPAYWLVNTATRQVEAWTPEATFPTTHRDQLTWHPAGAPDPLIIDLGALLA